MRTYTNMWTGEKVQLRFSHYEFFNAEYHSIYFDIDGNQWTGTNGLTVTKVTL